MLKFNVTSVVALSVAFALCSSAVNAQSRKDKKEARLAESEQPRDISGGVTFQANLPADKAFEAAVKYFQLHDVSLDETSKKDLGQLITAIRIVDVGGFRNNNKGYRTYVTFIRDSDVATIVKVKVTVQQRTKHVQAEPWTDPKILEKETSDTAEELKATLSGASAAR